MVGISKISLRSFAFNAIQNLSRKEWLNDLIRSAEDKQRHGILLSRDLAYHLVHECIKQNDLHLGRRLYSLIIYSGLDLVAVFGDHFIRLFAACGSLEEATKAFTRVLNPTQYTWTAIIDGYLKLGEEQMALQMHETMQYEGTKPDRCTFLSILKIVSRLGALLHGRQIHDEIVTCGLQSDVVIGSALIDMYAKCRSLEEAETVFSRLPYQNVVTWGAMISGYALNEQRPLAICCFEDMYYEKSVKPSKVTFMSILKACNIIGGIQQGRKIHEHIIESGLEPDLALGTTLIDMYAKSGNFDEAHRVLEKLTYRDVVAFGAIIGGYAELKEGLLALKIFCDMKSEGIKPDKIIYLSTLKACGSLGIIEHGRLIHEQIIQERLQFDNAIESSLVDMYATCGNMEEAGIFFRLLPNRNVVAWAAMIAGYAQLGDARSAVQYFQDMQCIGLKPDDIAFTSILTACNRTGLVDEGRLYLKLMSECHGIRPGAFHITCMVDLLGRAGCFREAEILSGRGIEYDSCLWMTLLSACRIHSNMELVKLNDSWERSCSLTKPAI